MGNTKKKPKGFNYSPSAEELEIFMNFLEGLEKEIRKSVKNKHVVHSKKKTRSKIKNRKNLDPKIQELPFIFRENS